MIEWLFILVRFLHGLRTNAFALPRRDGERRELPRGPIPLDLLLSGWCSVPSVCSNLSKLARPAGA